MKMKLINGHGKMDYKKKETNPIDRIIEGRTHINLPLPHTKRLERKALLYLSYHDIIYCADEKPSKEYFNEFKQELSYYQHVKEEYDKLNYVVDNEIDLITVNGEDKIPDYMIITEDDRIWISIIIDILKDIIEESKNH